MRTRLIWLVAGLITGNIVFVRPAMGQTSFPMLGSVYPAGVQRGKTTEVTVHSGGNGGGNLYGAYKAMFEGTGIQAVIVPPEKGWPAKDPKKPWELPSVDQVKMRVTVPADFPVGVREFRIATPRHGTSTVAQLVIGDEPEVMEAEPNNDPEKAQVVPLPCVINGKIQQGEDVDNYKFKVSAGQEVVFTALCARLQDKVHDLQEHADPLIILRDTAGNELARNDDYYRADPLLHYKFEKAGDYILQIRDVSYKGNPHWVYRLTMTTRPYVTAALPCAVRPGQSVEMHLSGFMLGDNKTARLTVPADAPRGLWSAQLKLPNGLTNAVSLLVTDVPQTVIERKPAPATNKPVAVSLQNAPRPTPSASPMSLPGGVNSALVTEGQIDRYTIKAKKGQAWGFEVTARRIDSNMDSELKLRDAKGNVLATNDDAEGKDSRIEWTAPADGDYLLDVRDLTGHAGATYFYNLTAHPLSPDFRLKCDTDRAMIAPGNRTTWYVLVERKYGFAGDIQVEVKGLPAGVSALPLTIPANLTTGTLFLSAAQDAKIDATQVEVVGKAMLPGAEGKPTSVSHIAHPITEIYMPGGGRGLLEVKTQAVGVSETNDIEVTATPQQITLAPGGTMKIEVALKRRPDYNKAVSLDIRVQHLGGIFVNPLPPGVSMDDATIPENQSKGTITLKVAPDAPPIKDLPIAVFGNVSINFVMKVWYSATPISLSITPKK